ncbi:MAG: hypothetical protein Q4A62_10910 [Eikenella sp.]|nr:hypothetical protein [Eikenella sp.]
MNNPYHASPAPEHAAVPAMTVGDWLLTLVLLSVPLLNLVLVLVWAFDGRTNPNKANFCKAYLILMAAVMLLAVLLVLGLGVLVDASGYGRYR